MKILSNCNEYMIKINQGSENEIEIKESDLSTLRELISEKLFGIEFSELQEGLQQIQDTNKKSFLKFLDEEVLLKSRVLWALGDKDAANEIIQGLDDDNKQIINYKLGISLAETSGPNSETIELLTNAHQGPDKLLTQRAYYNIGLEYSQTEDTYNMAIEYFQKSLKGGDEYKQLSYFQMGYIYHGKGDEKKTLDFLKKSLGIGEDKNVINEANFFIGMLYYNNNDINKGLTYFLKVVEDKDFFERKDDSYVFIGQILIELGYINEAQKNLKKVSDFNSILFQHANHHLAICSMKLGENEEVLSYLETVANGPDGILKEQALEGLAGFYSNQGNIYN